MSQSGTINGCPQQSGCYSSPSCGTPPPVPSPTPTPPGASPTPTPTPPPGEQWCGNCQNQTCGLRDAAGCAAVGDTDGDGQCEGDCSAPPPTNVDGYHDAWGYNPSDTRTDSYNQTLQPSSTCRAAGWAADQDDRNQDVNVRVLADGNEIASGNAGGYRDGLGIVCDGATCAYDFLISGSISSGVDHTIKVQAQDINNGQWKDLTLTPRTLNCCAPPVTPSNLQPTGNLSCTVGAINLTWSNTSAARYALEIDDTTTPHAPISGTSCPGQYSGDVCNTNVTGTSYSFTPTGGRQYRFRVRAINSCNEMSSVSAWNYFTKPALSISPSTVSIAHPGTQTFDAILTPSGTTVGRVDFDVSVNPGNLSVSPASDTTANPYRTTGTTLAAGTATVRGRAYSAASGGTLLCTGTSAVTITSSAVPWWQVRGGDVVVKGDLTSYVPSTCSGACTPIFNLQRDTTAPISASVNIYDGNADFSNSGASVGTGSQPTDYKVNTNIQMSQDYNYNYFANLIPSNVTPYEIPSTTTSISVAELSTLGGAGALDSQGYRYIRKSTGNTQLTLTGARTNMNDKVILFLNDGWLVLGNDAASTLTLNDGVGFFMAVARRGRIFVNNNVVSSSNTDYKYEGIFLSDWEFRTSTNTPTSVGRLALRGIFVGLNRSGGAGLEGIELRRTLADNSATPSEHFEYAPELLMLFPKALSNKKTSWNEVVP